MQNINRGNYEEQNSSQNIIKTPATLFSKSSAKSPVARIQNSSLQDSLPECMCYNHTSKLALYYTLTDGQILYFCEKCAITLASQGHVINKTPATNSVSQSPTPNQSLSRANSTSKSRLLSSRRRNREEEIGGFLEELSDMRDRIGQTRDAIKDKLIESQQFYGEQLQQINNYFTLIVKSLQLQKHKCYNHILKERSQAEEHIRDMDEQLRMMDEGVTKIQVDIEDNLDTVYTIEEDMYKLVFQQYITQQEEFGSTINGLLMTPIEMRRIQFQGVPESIYNLSDLVIQNSINNDHQQYRLVDSLNCEDLATISAVSPRQPFRNRETVNQAESLKFSFEAERLREEGLKSMAY